MNIIYILFEYFPKIEREKSVILTVGGLNVANVVGVNVGVVTVDVVELVVMIESESSSVKFCSILFSELLRFTFSSKYKLLNLSII